MVNDESMKAPEKEQIVYDAAGHYASYLEYNKILRTWFVAFGVGGAVLFLINANLADRVEIGVKLLAVKSIEPLGSRVG